MSQKIKTATKPKNKQTNKNCNTLDISYLEDRTKDIFPTKTFSEDFKMSSLKPEEIGELSSPWTQKWQK